MKLIPLTNHYEFVYVNDNDYDLLSRYEWHLANYGYAAYSPGSGKRIFMHRLVAAAADRHEIDHIDTNKLNNQYTNLRKSNKKFNSANREKQKGEYTSKYKGVSVYNSRGKSKWRAYIFVDYKQIHLGIFNTQIEAAKAYDKAALKYFGEHARFNFPNFFLPSIEEE